MSGPSDYLAAERTFLAWIRTGLALMGLGFVVARFGLFLQAMQVTTPALPTQSYGLSFWLGTAFIIMGVAVNLLSVRNHLGMVRDLKSGGTSFARPSALAIGLSIALSVVGLGIAIYLISFRDLSPSKTDNRKESSMTNPDSGIITEPSIHSVDETVQKLEATLQAKGVKLFALIDHSGEAEKSGLHMPPTKLLIFGNPKAGTPLMLASPSIAIDLPLKILVAQDSQGKVWVSYNSPAYLQARHALPSDLLANIAVVKGLAAAASQS